MKVGIDTFGCGHGQSGLSSYLDSLVTNLKNDGDIEYELFGSEIDRYTYGAENGFKYAAVTIPDVRRIKSLWHYFGVNFFASRHKYDAVLYTAAAHLLPLFYTIPGVAVINDVLSELYAEQVLSSKEFRVLIGLKNASRIIAASRFIRDDLEKIGINGNKIEVIHNGIDHSQFYPREMLSSDFVDIKPFAIKRPYFIYASRMSSQTKKHVELIRAFTKFKKRTKLPHRLVLAGSEGLYFDSVKKAAAESDFASDIFITGFFPHEHFPELYSGSEGCLFPSVNEGVGLPVLEAMATGVPVACSNAGALSEIAGNNAIFFDSDDINQMADAIESLASDKNLRTRLRSGGIERAKNFSWKKTAEKTKKVLIKATKR